MPAGEKNYDPNFTQHVIDTCGPNTSPRMKEIFGAAMKALHNFAREIDLTPEEWLVGVQFFNETGKIWAESEGKRNEMHRLSDITGLESCDTSQYPDIRAPLMHSQPRHRNSKLRPNRRPKLLPHLGRHPRPLLVPQRPLAPTRGLHNPRPALRHSNLHARHHPGPQNPATHPERDV